MQKFYAAIDYGSNTTLLLVARELENGRLTEECELYRTTRLAAEMQETGVLNAEGVRKSLIATNRFLKHLTHLKGEVRGIAVATSAVREAKENQDFLAAIREVLGKAPVVFTGCEEAETTFLGASTVAEENQPCLTIDIGGGSSEIGAGSSDGCLLAKSIKLGCVGVSQQYNLNQSFSSADLEVAAASANKLLGTEIDNAEKVFTARVRRECLELIVSGGTATTLGAYYLGLEDYDAKKVHGLNISADFVDKSLAKLSRLSVAERAELAGITAARAPVFPGGLIILRELLRLLNIKTFKVSTRGLRFGLVQRLHLGQLEPTFILNNQ
ncbi:MAG: hypothetical protein ACOCZS_05105 [Verrucomicrobiota bacterium]